MIKTVLTVCPKCGETNCWNIYKETIYETSVKWFMCSVCYKPSDVPEWKEKPQAIVPTALPSVAEAEGRFLNGLHRDHINYQHVLEPSNLARKNHKEG